MTKDTTTPERIWVDDERPIGGDLHVFTNPPAIGAEKYVTEYIRADHALALVADAYEKAASEADYFSDMDYGLMHYPESDAIACGSIANEIRTQIRTLTPADASAARESRDKQVREDALRKAAEVASGFANGDDAWQAILALIEKDKTDE